MQPGCWHATRIKSDEVRCAMLTRRSTTLDLASHLKKAARCEKAPATVFRSIWFEKQDRPAAIITGHST